MTTPKKKKTKLKLVTSSEVKKYYEIITIMFYDNDSMKYDLAEWDFQADMDFVELWKKDKTAMRCYPLQNIVCVAFDKKEVKIKDASVLGDLKPIA